MTKENRDELILIDGEYYSHNEIVAIIESNNELARKNERQSNFIRALKLQNEELTVERNALLDELTTIKNMSMFEFGNTHCSTESLEADGKAFARSLLGKPITQEEEVIYEAENAYVPYSGDDF
ncbi:MAG: hypothetical protein IKF11_00920 [Methanobrevibacter sp.]|nr:hypothetical protein [Methanobrevibacter sp.]